MKLKIVDVNSAELDLSIPQPWMMELDPVKRRVKTTNRYGRSGANIVSDRSEEVRKLILKTDLTAKNDADYVTAVSNIYKFFALDRAPLYLIDTDTNRQIQIELENFDGKVGTPNNERRHEKLKINCICPDVFWEDSSETINNNLNVANAAVLNITNNGAVDFYPIIEVTAKSSNPDFSLFNLTTGVKIKIASSLFATTNIITIDSIEGTVNLNDGVNNNNIINSVVDGTGFMYLTPGTNQIRYNSIYGNCDVKFRYRERAVY